MSIESATKMQSQQSGFHGDRADLPVVAEQRRSKLDTDGSGGLNIGAAVWKKTSSKPTKSLGYFHNPASLRNMSEMSHQTTLLAWAGKKGRLS